MIKLQHIHYQIGRKTILHDINLPIAPGKFTAILGPNGAGKSTLLKIMAGDIKQYEGKVEINTQNQQKFSHKELALMRAVLPQSIHIQFPYTVLEIAQLGGFSLPLTRQQAASLACEMLQKVGMLDFRNRIYNTLSGGEKQRVQLARVMAQISHNLTPSKYLLLDEPTTSLDIACQHQILQQAKNLCRENIGILVVLHDLNLAGQYADHILMMKNGKEVAQGTVQKIFTKENIEFAYEHPVQLQYLFEGKQPYVVPLVATGPILNGKSIYQPNGTYHE
jgi:iron complex transport system ATP-binding protein